jgi:hypothetical protein
MTFPLAAGINAYLDTIRTRHRAKRMLARSPYARLIDQELPLGLYAHWVSTARNEFEGIPLEPFFFARAAEALLMFFDCVVRSGERCALPSKAADSVWHAWEQHSPATLAAFCLRHFGRPIPHMDADAMVQAHDKDQEQAAAGRPLAVCLVQARKAERLALAGDRLPRLFTLDAETRMPFGNGYRNIDGVVAFGRLDRDGKWPAQHTYPAVLWAAELCSLGLIPADELAMRQRAAIGDGGGSMTWTDSGSSHSGCSDGGGGSDSGCSDGGGSSCGSSGCGSGCGSS